MKKFALAMGLASVMAFTCLPAAADTDTSSTTTVAPIGGVGYTLGPGDILRLDQPLRMTGTVDELRTGLVHMTMTDGSHLIVAESFPFFRDGMRIPGSILANGSTATVELPASNVWVLRTGANIPFASMFGDSVLVLGGYRGPAWISPASLAAADVELVASAVETSDVHAAKTDTDKY